MTIFWIMAAGLAGLALLFVVTPLLSQPKQNNDVDQDELNLAVFRQQLDELDADLAAGELDQHQYNASRRDLERELLYDVTGSGDNAKKAGTGSGRWVAALLGVAIPAAAVSLYLYLGESAIIPRLEVAANNPAPAAPAAHPGAEGRQMPPLEVMVQRLAEKMEEDPENLQGWMMLGRSYFAVRQPERALYALEKAYGLAPEQPDVLVAYAEAIAANSGNKLDGRSAELIRAALVIDPQHTSARWLAGLVSFQGGGFEQAAAQWEELLASFDPQSSEADDLRGYIKEARSRAGLEPDQVQTPAPDQVAGAAQPTAAPAESAPGTANDQSQTQAATAQGVTVEVSLAEPLWPQADVNDSLFVYAKAVSGPPMPLAAKRVRVADLPVTVTLDDSMAMIPTMRLSAFPEVTVGARVSKSGQATPQSGDLEGEVSPVKIGQAGAVKVVIDHIRP